MDAILNKIPKTFWACLGISLLPVSFGVGYIISQSSGVEYTRGNDGTSITIDTASKIKKASNDTEYANEVLKTKINAIEETLEFLIVNDTTPDPVLQTIKKDIEELEPVVKEIDRSNEELQEVAEEVGDRQ